jgi:hypothetical protein
MKQLYHDAMQSCVSTMLQHQRLVDCLIVDCPSQVMDDPRLEAKILAITEWTPAAILFMLHQNQCYTSKLSPLLVQFMKDGIECPTTEHHRVAELVRKTDDVKLQPIIQANFSSLPVPVASRNCIRAWVANILQTMDQEDKDQMSKLDKVAIYDYVTSTKHTRSLLSGHRDLRQTLATRGCNFDELLKCRFEMENANLGRRFRMHNIALACLPHVTWVDGQVTLPDYYQI